MIDIVGIATLPLKWQDVLLDSDPACIHVRDSKSAAGLRTVWLTNHCRDEMLKWRINSGPDSSSNVFPSSRIPRVHITDYKKAWHKAAREAGLKNCRIYDLRSTFASRANGCKASGLTVAHLLGHESTQILPTYVKPLDENTRVLIEALDSARLSHKRTRVGQLSEATSRRIGPKTGYIRHIGLSRFHHIRQIPSVKSHHETSAK